MSYTEPIGIPIAAYDGSATDAVWMALSAAGGTTDFDGNITISDIGNITVQIDYNGFILIKIITLIYEPWVYTETTMDPDPDLIRIPDSGFRI